MSKLKMVAKLLPRGNEGSSSQDGHQNESQTETLSPPSGNHGDSVDAVLSNFKSILETADKALSGVPVPGLDHVLPIIEAIMDRVTAMRANVREKSDVVKRIETLLELLGSNLNLVNSELERMDPATRQRVRDDIQSSDILRQRVDGLVSKLRDILTSARQARHERWYSKLWFADQDAELLQSIRRKIVEAIEDFKLQGGIDIRRFLGTLADQTARIEREQHEYHIRVEQIGKEQAEFETLDRLRPANASYKSSLTDEKSRLQPGTRQEILRDLSDWVMKSPQPQRVYVLHGRAGMGKSSIAHALSRQFADTHLGSSYFFNRASEECSDALRVLPTMAYQIANSTRALRSHFAEAVRKHLLSGDSQMVEHQLQELLNTPFEAAVDAKALDMTIPMLLVVDGVDECSNNPEDIVPRLLRLLCLAARKFPFLRIVIATRPETYIMGAFKSTPDSGTIVSRDLQLVPGIDRDIRLFIDTEFNKCAESGPFMLMKERPDAAATLTELADGLFIYASTIARFLIRHVTLKRRTLGSADTPTADN
ncbi:hypothetical protein OBBRIDRAFT_769369 [Obba rivulosa]|uniref:NACHT domain-containing protein n=1 Tax=Obba rivulosa TaxID=1052685 RepID=A0A8E2DS13_9APHY|nr:hypothetical protein OBBRIDRAFT_769369 [Obba rivulosa]